MTSPVSKMRLIIFIACLSVSETVASSTISEGNKVCLSERCQVAAHVITNAMNKNVEPCDDFYKYACGSWESNFPKPDNEDLWNLDRLTESNISREVKDILEGEEDDDDFTPLKYEKQMYKSCMDTDKIEEIGIKPLEDILDNLGGWPILMGINNWNDENHSWQSVHEYYTRFRDLSSIFDIRVSTDDANVTRNAIHIDKPNESLLDRLLENGDETSILQKYTDFIKDVVAVFIRSAGKQIDENDIAKDIEDIVTFEKNLRSIKYSGIESDDSNSTDVHMTIEELQHFYDGEKDKEATSKINWYLVITTLFNNIPNVTIEDSEEIGVEDTNYLQKLSELLNQTPNRVIVNYVHWKFVASSLKYTNREMNDLFFQLTKTTDDNEVINDRSDTCMSDIKLGIGYRYEYLKRHFTDEDKKLVFDIANEMRSEMLDEIEHSSWLDDVTKEESLIKLHALKWQIGVSNFFSRKEFLEHIYDQLSITLNYFENIQNVREFFINRSLKRLRTTRNLQAHIRIDPLLAKSIYNPKHNIFGITFGQLTVPLFHSSLPLSVNYGYIAPTMGQLISHVMDKEVNLNTYVTPWSMELGETYKNYEAKTNCLIRQYSNYSIGLSALDGNMYDAIGLKAAYDAFQNSLIDEQIEKLPGLEELSDDQLFFISFAIKYCQSVSPKYIAEHDTSFYTPSEYRVIGTLSNFDYFAKAFNCPPNSYMNPEDKCVL